MSFQKTIKKILNPAQLARFDSNFTSTYSAAVAESNLLIGKLTAPKPTSSTTTQTQDLNALRDSVFAYSRQSDYAAVSQGLVYLTAVTDASASQSTSAQSGRFGGAVAAGDIQKMSRTDGVRFVKTALGLNVVEQLHNDALHQSASSFAGKVFGSMQAATFSAAKFFDEAKHISETIFTTVTSQSYASVLNGVESSIGLFNEIRSIQRRLFFGDTFNVDQNRLRDIGRMPEMKLRFMFYCDVTLWSGRIYRLMTLKSVTGASVQFTQDEVNFYGLRSTVNKSSKYGNITLVLHDDADNNTAEAMMTLLSLSTGSFGDGMEFAQRNLQDLAGNNSDTSYQSSGGMIPSVATLNERNGIIKSIKTTQVYMQDNRIVRDVYTYINPKIMSLVKSDFDMDNNSDVQNFTLEVSYDALNVILGAEENYNWREERDSDWGISRGIF